MAIEIVDLPTNSMVIFHSFLHSYVNVYQRVPPNPYENGLMTISQDCSKSAHKTVENNIWTHLGHRTCCWNRFNPRAFVKWGFQFFSTSDQISLKKFLLRGIFGVLKKKKRDPRFSMANPPHSWLQSMPQPAPQRPVPASAAAAAATREDAAPGKPPKTGSQ